MHFARNSSNELLGGTGNLGIGQKEPDGGKSKQNESRQVELGRPTYLDSYTSSPPQSTHSTRIPVHCSRKAKRTALDGDCIVDSARVAMNDLLGQESPSVDEVCLIGRDTLMSRIRCIRHRALSCGINVELIEEP